MAATVQLDKTSVSATEGYGTVAIRVVVLEKGPPEPVGIAVQDESPADAAPDETLPDDDKRPTSGYLEEPKRGRQCCVFLINGQRQHAWDNQFIVRDLDLKYLRNRMIVIVDCDGLRPEAIAQLMQGSRFQFLEGSVYDALAARVVATLKGDPDLRRLEEDAEDDIANLQAGDEAVKAALDQLIEAHHDAAAQTAHGDAQPGETTRDGAGPGGLNQTNLAVAETAEKTAQPASQPVLAIRPDLPTIRLKPSEPKRIVVFSKPDGAWSALQRLGITIAPPIKELQVTRTTQAASEEIQLTFARPADFDDDEYPIEATFRATASFAGQDQERFLERRIVVTPRRPTNPETPTQYPLKDDPTFIRVTSRLPIKIVIGGPDVHIKMRWNGKDELAAGAAPRWVFRSSCESPSIDPQRFLTRPNGGRFELLVQAAPGLKHGDQLKFTVDACGPGKTLTTSFIAEVTDPPEAHQAPVVQTGGTQRRPPYVLKAVYRNDWNSESCWGGVWSGDDPGAFEEPSSKSPLTIFINNDLEMLVAYREGLLARKMADTTIRQRINKYTAHVAFHLYQMYMGQIESRPQAAGTLTEDQMKQEIRRVSQTLIRIMEVGQ